MLNYRIPLIALLVLSGSLGAVAQEAGGFSLEMDTAAPAPAADETVFVNEQGDTVPPESLQANAPVLDSVPKLRQFIEAIYPAAALKKGLEGQVICEFLVTNSGRV